MIEVTDEAIKHLLQKQEEERFSHIRLGITGGGCAGFEYIFAVDDIQDDDIVLDYVKEGLNEFFKFINPKEQSSCGCGVSINFDLEAVEADEQKIFAVEV